MEILLILVSIIITILNILVFGMIVILERNNRIKKIKTNLGYFSPSKLSRWTETYSSQTKNNSEIKDISKRAEELEKRDFKQLMKLVSKMQELTLPINVFKFYSFSKLYKDLLIKIKEYEREYLNVRFSLFDLTADIEIEKAILLQLKKRFAKTREAVLNSPIDRIRNNKKLNNKINKILSNIKKLEEMINEQIKHLSEQFIEFIRKIDLDIVSLTSNLYFLNFHIKHIEEDLSGPLNKIIEAYKSNKNLLSEIEIPIKLMVKNFGDLKREIILDTDEIKTKKVIENTEKLDSLIFELALLINSNIDYAKFNIEYNYITEEIFGFVKENHGLFISEIKRHLIDNENQRLSSIEKALESFENSISKYEKEKIDKTKLNSPQTLNNLLLDIINEYQNYTKVVKENIKDISQVNSLTNDINREIAQMNTALLQIEYNINSLNGVSKENFIKKKDELQIKVSNLRENFKENTKKVDERTFKIVNKLKTEVNTLVDKTKGSAFELFFLKEIIMFLNRKKGLNNKYDQMLDSITISFNEEKYNDSLRKSRELIEIYGIK